MSFLKVLFMYLGNLFIWNRDGWYIGDYPSSDAQGWRIITKQKVYRELTCKMCKRKFWSYKKPDVCFRIECYFKYNLRRLNATDTVKN